MPTKKQLKSQLADAREALEAEQRKTRVQQVEIDSLAAVIARDRQRVKAETAIASKTIAAKTIDEAASMVAGYVARQVFSRDPATPAWCYGTSDGRDLGALLLARQERVYVESTDDVAASRLRQIELLWSVTGADRCAGVVRYELAGLEDLEREQLVALRLHAMNREQYPRFFRGTYAHPRPGPLAAMAAQDRFLDRRLQHRLPLRGPRQGPSRRRGPGHREPAPRGTQPRLRSGAAARLDLQRPRLRAAAGRGLPVQAGQGLPRGPGAARLPDAAGPSAPHRPVSDRPGKRHTAARAWPLRRAGRS